MRKGEEKRGENRFGPPLRKKAPQNASLEEKREQKFFIVLGEGRKEEERKKRDH